MQILYKYMCFDQNALSLLINRTLYFADPLKLNDPYDCQIGTITALRSSFSSKDIREMVFGKLSEPKCFDFEPEEILENIEKRLRRVGVLCLSKDNLNAVMWSHYADKHQGFCIGLDLSDKFTAFCPPRGIWGAHECSYSAVNPFSSYLTKRATPEEKISFDIFLIKLLILGASSKSEGWKYEAEVRIIKDGPGEVTFEPAELRHIIFGMNMDNHNKLTIKTLLSSADWKHILYLQVKRNEDGFGLRLDPV